MSSVVSWKIKFFRWFPINKWFWLVLISQFVNSILQLFILPLQRLNSINQFLRLVGRWLSTWWKCGKFLPLCLNPSDLVSRGHPSFKFQIDLTENVRQNQNNFKSSKFTATDGGHSNVFVYWKFEMKNLNLVERLNTMILSNWTQKMISY